MWEASSLESGHKILLQNSNASGITWASIPDKLHISDFLQSGSAVQKHPMHLQNGTELQKCIRLWVSWDHKPVVRVLILP